MLPYDRPTLYFSYNLDTENDSSAPVDVMMRDAFRVYVSDNSGDWQLLSTNNSYTGPFFVDDELVDYDAFGSPFTPSPGDATVQYFDVQETFNVRDWRQARVPLDQYAGRTNLRLRFDFTTGGDLNLGDAGTTGEEVRAVAGILLNDGDTMTIGGQTLEFDSGLTIVAPAGAAIPPGEQLTITDGADNTAILQFVNDVLTVSNIVVPAGSQLNDGDTFQIGDEFATLSFEFDSGYIIAAPPPAARGSTIKRSLRSIWTARGPTCQRPSSSTRMGC